MSPGYDWGQILASVGAGLSAAGAPGGGWSAFAPALTQARQGYQANAMDRRRFQIVEDEAKRAQQQWEEQQRVANQERADQDRINRQWTDFVASRGGLMQPPSGVTTASGLMDRPRFIGGAGSGPSNFQQPDALKASASLSNVPSGIGRTAANIGPGPMQGGGFDFTPDQWSILGMLPAQEGMKVVAERALATPKDNRTADEQNYEYAKSQGYPGTFLEFQTELKRSGRPQNIVNLPGNMMPDERGRGAFAEANAKAQADYFDKVATAGAQANQRLGDINQLTSLIETTPQGAGQDYLNKGAAVLSRFGIDLGEYTNVPAAQAFQSIVSRIAPTLRVAGSGATSDFEMNQFLQTLPAIGNMPDGNRIIASNLKKIADRSVQEAYIASQVQGGDLTPAQGRKKILDLGALNLDLPTFGGAPAGGPGGAPDMSGGAGSSGGDIRRVDQLPEGFQ
jgi:hypothetical protein